MIKNLIPIALDPVSVQGYSHRDLNQYYSNTFLLYRGSDGDQVVISMEVDSDNAFVCRTGKDSVLRIHSEYLFRFTPEQGFFVHKGKLMEYTYVFSKSYKKGLNYDFVRFNESGSRGFHSSRGGTLSHILYLEAVLDQSTACSDPTETIISKRICCSGGKIHMALVGKTVGDYDGELKTPFGSIIERTNLNKGDIVCHLTQLKAI